MAKAAGSQPGVSHIEFHWPEKNGVMFYDGKQTSVEAIVKLVEEKTKRKLTVTVDRPLP